MEISSVESLAMVLTSNILKKEVDFVRDSIDNEDISFIIYRDMQIVMDILDSIYQRLFLL